ncbi:hypothetical protein N0V93_008708 [Gnomoniopsis smithogilvyi]|uniref:Heterokaryon incompatibility domain-containing protein n=1 Tax=Gnomoniopsis smithogilvyi TaxID=1191159 RepID=A0A9W8YPN5_9PEZI|nr:hypothetical protein N0V93_008708 [Gnomoniopsis smithogilvyi]
MARTKRCRYCEKLSIESLVSLAKDELHGYRKFPKKAFCEHQPSVEDLESSAKDGCDLCGLILDCLLVTTAKDTYWTISDPEEQDCSPDDSLYAAAKCLETSSVKIAISADHLDIERQPLPAGYQLDTILIQVGPKRTEIGRLYWLLEPLRLTIHLPVGSKEAFHIDGCRFGRSELVSDLAAPENFEIARGWLQSCRQEHANCPSDGLHALPTRVVDVGVEPDFRDLHIIHSHGKMGYYIALSHCWGGKITPLLTAETLETFTAALPFSDLPANFRDAVTITRELGLRYLWIDSLCIMQDSKHDWEVESIKMADVYRHALLTVSALSSPRSTHGILTKHAQLSRPVKTVKLSCQSKSHEVNVSRMNRRSECLTALAWDCPLYQRGWSLQEMVLSPRQLLYGEQQIYWRCPHGFRDAEGTGPAPGSRFPSRVFETLASVLYADILRPSSGEGTNAQWDIEIILTEYYQLVGNYSRRKLRFGSDKLPAISGIVQRLHPVIGGDYLAGLWSRDLYRGISWLAKNSVTKHATPSRAPSWSWAVTDGPVAMYMHAEDVRSAGPDNPLSMKLIAHDLSLEKPYGAVASGTLVVTGLTRPVRFSTQVVDAQQSRMNWGFVMLDEPLISLRPRISLFPTTGDGLLAVNTTNGNNEDWQPEEEAILPGSYIALLVHAEVEADGEWTEDRAFLLVLEQKDNKASEEYQRIGVVTMKSVKVSWLNRWESRTIQLV